MGGKPRPRRRRARHMVVCTSCRERRTSPEPMTQCSCCDVYICTHLEGNLVKKNQFFDDNHECVWCYSLLVIEDEPE